MASQQTKSNGSNFHSSGLRQKVDQLMDILWAGGVNNPMDSIEQLSYLIFLRLLTEKDELLAKLDRKKYQRIFSGKGARYGWGNFVTLTGDQLFDAIRSAIESLHELPGLSETGRLLFNRATLKIYDRPTLRAAIQTIHELDLNPRDGQDIKGDMYEYLLSKIAMSGTNGQFRTPRHIIAMMVAMVDPKPGLRICDPACGTAGFLIASFNYILAKYQGTGRKNYPGGTLTEPQWKFMEEQAFTGYDNDANMVKIAILNLYLHRLEKANIEFHNPLTTGKGSPYPGLTFDVILANPPFAGKIQEDSILTDINLKTRDTELLFLKWFIDHLAPGGRGGVIVPNGVLFGSTKAARKVRELLLTECELQAVVSLPSGVFKPYSGVGTATLIFEKRGTGVSPVMKHGQDGHATFGGTGLQPVKYHGQDDHATLKIRHGAYLPHWTREDAIYAVTFRLTDSLPKSVVESWNFERQDIKRTARQMKRLLTKAEEKRLAKLFSDKVEKYLDECEGQCWMRRDDIAGIVAGALKHFDGERYRLVAWCVMPNHVHVVVQPLPGYKLPDILQSWKSFSSKEANRMIGRTGGFWQPEYYDHLIRNEEDLARQIEYVLTNPAAAGLENWKWVGRGSGTDVPSVKSGSDVPSVTTHGQDGHATEFVWFYDLTADGFSLDDKRTPVEANDIPDALAKWPKRDEGPNSYRVPIEKIRENDLSLAAGRYKR